MSTQALCTALGEMAFAAAWAARRARDACAGDESLAAASLLSAGKGVGGGPGDVPGGRNRAAKVPPTRTPSGPGSDPGHRRRVAIVALAYRALGVSSTRVSRPPLATVPRAILTTRETCPLLLRPIPL